MDDLAQLQSRVDAARERLGNVDADQRKYGLRLDDLVRIVDGALTRQSEELKAVRIRAASLETELDDARIAVSRNELELAARETDIARLNAQNEQLRTMVMTLLEVVEGRNTTPMRDAMLRLERGVRNLIAAPGAGMPKPAAAATPPERVPVQRRAEPAPAKLPPTISPNPAPARPVLVPNQSITGRITMSAESERASESGDPLIELTAAGRGNAEQVVKEPPEAPVVQIVRRVAGDAAVSPASTDA